MSQGTSREGRIPHRLRLALVWAALLTGVTVGLLVLLLPTASGQAAQPMADLTFAVNNPADV